MLVVGVFLAIPALPVPGHPANDRQHARSKKTAGTVCRHGPILQEIPLVPDVYERINIFFPFENQPLPIKKYAVVAWLFQKFTMMKTCF